MPTVTSDEEWAREIVRKVAETERLGGGFRLYHEEAVRAIVKRLEDARRRGRSADPLWEDR